MLFRPIHFAIPLCASLAVPASGMAQSVQVITPAPVPVQSQVVIAPSAPPPPRIEAIPSAPPAQAQTMVWSPGHWTWDGASWSWKQGQYVMRPSPQAVWEPGHWLQRPSGGYVWVDGRWVS